MSDHNICRRGRNVRSKPLYKHDWVPRYISQCRANIASVTQKENIQSKPLHNRDYVFQYITVLYNKAKTSTNNYLDNREAKLIIH